MLLLHFAVWMCRVMCGGTTYPFQIQQQDMDAAGVNLTAIVSSTSTLGVPLQETTDVWHVLTPVSSVLVGEQCVRSFKPGRQSTTTLRSVRGRVVAIRKLGRGAVSLVARSGDIFLVRQPDLATTFVRRYGLHTLTRRYVKIYV